MESHRLTFTRIALVSGLMITCGRVKRQHLDRLSGYFCGMEHMEHGIKDAAAKICFQTNHIVTVKARIARRKALRKKVLRGKAVRMEAQSHDASNPHATARTWPRGGWKSRDLQKWHQIVTRRKANNLISLLGKNAAIRLAVGVSTLCWVRSFSIKACRLVRRHADNIFPMKPLRVQPLRVQPLRVQPRKSFPIKQPRRKAQLPRPGSELSFLYLTSLIPESVFVTINITMAISAPNRIFPDSSTFTLDLVSAHDFRLFKNGASTFRARQERLQATVWYRQQSLRFLLRSWPEYLGFGRPTRR